MTVSTTSNRVSFSGNGSTAAFAYNFKIFADADLTVIIRSSAGVETTKTLTTHYTVSGAGTDSGGNVTFTSGNIPASGETIVILRELTLTQGTDYVANDPFPAESHEDALDRLTMITQQLDEAVGRSLKVSQTNVIATSDFTTSATDRANKILSFDGSGDLTVTEGKVDTVTASVSAVSAGGSPTASATYTASSGALALAFGLVTGNTGATGNSAGLQMTFSNSTSDADPGAGKVALNNGTLSSVSEIYIDDADDNGAAISTFIATFDDVSNATARGIIHIEKEGTAATFAIYKVTGAVTAASGYSKIPVTHLASNGTFSNTDGIRVDFAYSGNDGAGSLTNVVGDTSPELGGDLDVLARDVVSSSNRDIDLAPDGTGRVVIKGNDNQGSLVLNCENNSHGQKIIAASHSALNSNSGNPSTLTLPATGNASQELVATDATQTLTNKTISGGSISGITDLAIADGGTGASSASAARTALGLAIGSDIQAYNADTVFKDVQNTFTKSQIPSTYTAALSATSGVLDFDTYQNFIITLASGSNTLAAPTTEASNVGQTGVMIFIQPSSSSAATLSLHGDYESVGAGGITLSTANNDYDVVAYFVKADNSILLSPAQLNFG